MMESRVGGAEEGYGEVGGGRVNEARVEGEVLDAWRFAAAGQGT